MHSKFAAALLLTISAFAGDKKAFPGQAGNDNIELAATVFMTTSEIQPLVGNELGAGFIVSRVKVTNKTGEVMSVSPNDFALVSRKDGDRGDALAPGQIAGGSALVVKREQGGRDWAQQTNKPGFSGVAGLAKTEKPKDEALLAALKSKELADQQLRANQSSEGLLYFSMENSKLKAKDVALIYHGAGGHLTVDFK
jgi:hypothetical protein